MPRIHDPIYGYIEIEDYELSLIDNILFQRLRGIYQQGTAYLTYPSSTHTRFSHSLGVTKLTSDFLDILRKKTGRSIHEATFVLVKRAMRLIALWHDIGHGPFSHLSDRVFYQKLSDHDKREMSGMGIKSPHEYFTAKLIQEYMPTYLKNAEQDYKEFLETQRGDPVVTFDELKAFLDANGSRFFDKKSPIYHRPLKKLEILNYYQVFKQIINSDFDVDKIDYIQRDSYITGVKFGHLDVSGLLTNFEIDDRTVIGNLTLISPALSAIETLILERYKLYRWLAFHHTVCFTDELMTRIMETLSKKIPSSFTYDILKTIADRGLGVLQSDRNLKDLEIFDDHWVIHTLNTEYNKQPMDKDLELARYYLHLIEKRCFYTALWKVSTTFKLDEEQILFKLKEKIDSESDKGITFSMGVLSEIEKDMAESLKKDVIVSYKPYEPIALEPKISILEDGEPKTINEKSSVTKLLCHRRRYLPDILRKDLIQEVFNILNLKDVSFKDFQEKIQLCLNKYIPDTPPIFTPIYVHVRGLPQSEIERAKEEAFKIILKHL